LKYSGNEKMIIKILHMNIQIFKFCTFAYLSNIKINNS